MVVPRCQARNIRTGKRSCPHPSRFVIRAPYDELLVCGIHRRGRIRVASYPIGEAWRATPKTPGMQG
jgi:hypothetical protein